MLFGAGLSKGRTKNLKIQRTVAYHLLAGAVLWPPMVLNGVFRGYLRFVLVVTDTEDHHDSTPPSVPATVLGCTPPNRRMRSTLNPNPSAP